MPDSMMPVILIHPFHPNGAKGISAERGSKKGYTVGEVDACSADPRRQLVFQAAVACTDKEVWVRRWCQLNEKPKWQQIV